MVSPFFDSGEYVGKYKRADDYYLVKKQQVRKKCKKMRVKTRSGVCKKGTNQGKVKQSKSNENCPSPLV